MAAVRFDRSVDKAVAFAFALTRQRDRRVFVKPAVPPEGSERIFREARIDAGSFLCTPEAGRSSSLITLSCYYLTDRDVFFPGSSIFSEISCLTGRAKARECGYLITRGQWTV